MSRRIRVEGLSRIEGEAGFTVELKDGIVTRLELKVIEAPRFFEALLVGRSPQDIIDFTARICGICPVAYQLTAALALENLGGISTPPDIRKLRRLIYLAEWISSHAVSVFLLMGPDFYGIPAAWGDPRYLEHLQRGLSLKQSADQLIALLGGRPIHPVGVRIGGFFATPSRQALTTLAPTLQRSYENSLRALQWATALPFPFQEGDDQDCPYLALSHPTEYPLFDGVLRTSRGQTFAIADSLAAIEEYQTSYSTALHARLTDGGSTYLVGPLARLNLNHRLIPAEILAKLREGGLELPFTRRLHAIVARCVELAACFYEAVRIVEEYQQPSAPFVPVALPAGVASWATEAPRGLLLHRYELDEAGRVAACQLVPPTSQNLAMLEADLRAYVTAHATLATAALKRGIEQLIRSYDPCISCSVHLLRD